MTKYDAEPVLFPADGGYDRVRMQHPEEPTEPTRDLGRFAALEAMGRAIELPDDFEDGDFLERVRATLEESGEPLSMTRILMKEFGGNPTLTKDAFYRVFGIVLGAAKRGELIQSQQEVPSGKKLRLFGLAEPTVEAETEEPIEEPEATEVVTAETEPQPDYEYESELEWTHRRQHVPAEQRSSLDQMLDDAGVKGGGSKRGGKRPKAHKKLSGRPKSSDLKKPY